MGTEQLPQLSFDGIEFPYETIKVVGALRDHVHEYPHSPGGAPEKLGRKLYEFDIDSPFLGGLIPERYKALWPQNLNKLVALFEQGLTKDLVIPNIGGPVRAYCINWERILKARNTSGETTTLKFREDSEKLRLASEAFAAKTTGLSSAKTALDSEIRAVPGLNRNLFDTILFAVDDVLAYKDEFDLWTTLIEAKCLSVIAMVRNIVDTMDEIKDPSRWKIVDALHELWFETRKIYDDQKQVGLTSRWYTTNRDHMSMSQISTAIYGFSSNGGELLTLNNIPDPFDVPIGTRIRYYAQAA